MPGVTQALTFNFTHSVKYFQCDWNILFEGCAPIYNQELANIEDRQSRSQSQSVIIEINLSNCASAFALHMHDSGPEALVPPPPLFPLFHVMLPRWKGSHAVHSLSFACQGCAQKVCHEIKSLNYRTDSKSLRIHIFSSPAQWLRDKNISIFFRGARLEFWDCACLGKSGKNACAIIFWFFWGAWMMRGCLNYLIIWGCAMSPSLYITLYLQDMRFSQEAIDHDASTCMHAS